jgi:carbamoyltransferase
MVVLGISGRERHAASALVVNGKLVAAAAEEAFIGLPEVGYQHTGGFPFLAVRACLHKAGLSAHDVGTVVIAVDRGGKAQPGRPWKSAPSADGLAHLLAERPVVAVTSDVAHAAQALTLVGDRPAFVVILDLSADGNGSVYATAGSQPALVTKIEGPRRLAAAARQVAVALGCEPATLEALEGFGDPGSPEYVDELRRALPYSRGAGIRPSARILDGLLQRLTRESAGRLRDPSSPHVKTRKQRADLAASLVARTSEIACAIVSEVVNDVGDAPIVVSGSLFASHAVSAALIRQFGDRVRVAPVPGPLGVALGAAVSACDCVVQPLESGLSLGPSFGEPDVKAALDGCRLDYVYEPDWARIYARVSRLLAKGKLVAWFQGAMDYGPRSLGNRSILCDPSSRYSRENVNRYFRQRPQDPPPPLVIRMEQTAECLEEPVCNPLGLTTASVRASWRDRLQGAVDSKNRCRVQSLVPSQSARLGELLDHHFQSTGVPGLIGVDLAGPCETTACTPRDAIRVTFSTAVDALVMERFIVMKDYWLLRSETE